MGHTTTTFHRACRTGADFLRAGAIVAAVVAAFTALDGVVRFGLLFLALLVPRLARLPPALDLWVGVVLTVATWSSPAHWYALAPWYDTVLHLVAPGTVATAGYLLLAQVRLLPWPETHELRIAAIPMITTALGSAVALLWELYEWFGKEVLGEQIRAHYDDTIADLAAGFLSSLVAGLLLAAWGRRRQRLSSTRE